MPGRNGTGPRGCGPRTGWGLGPCGTGIRGGYGGFGRGFGRGYGWGYAPSTYTPPSREEERSMLQGELSAMETQMRDIQTRLDELDKK